MTGRDPENFVPFRPNQLSGIRELFHLSIS